MEVTLIVNGNKESKTVKDNAILETILPQNLISRLKAGRIQIVNQDGIFASLMYVLQTDDVLAVIYPIKQAGKSFPPAKVVANKFGEMLDLAEYSSFGSNLKKLGLDLWELRIQQAKQLACNWLI